MQLLLVETLKILQWQQTDHALSPDPSPVSFNLSSHKVALKIC